MIILKNVKEGYWQKILGAADIPSVVFNGGFRTEMFGNRELILENHKGILEYGTELIRINCEKMTVKIEGEELTLVAMNSNAISIKGNILSISYSN